MARTVAALVAVSILSGFAWYQDVATHTVVRGDTLWDLAERYYQDPWDWRRIWEANRDEITNPNLIYPDQVFVIPGHEAVVSEVEVQGEPMGPPPPPRMARGQERTVFYRDTANVRSGVIGSERTSYLAVARDQVYSAPWLVRLGQEPEARGHIDAFAGGAALSSTPRGYDRVRIELADGTARVGDRLHVFRVSHTIDGVGHVVTPTGVVTVSDVGSGVVGVVTKEYHRIQLGDRVGTLPAFDLTPGRLARALPDGPHAMIMGFSGRNQVQDVESVAFLDLGAADGVLVGDEFVYENPEAGEGIVEGLLQVVGVREGSASARIVRMSDVVFQPGLVVRMSRSMR